MRKIARRDLILFLASAAILAVVFFVYLNGRVFGCYSSETSIVKGNSLSGVLEDGSTVKVLKGYYECHPVRRGDLVVYNYPDAPQPLLKIITAIPGDSFSLEPNEDGSWTIYVNGNPLPSPRGGYYTVDRAAYPRFHLYEVDYGRSLPWDVYMILGTDPRDSLDSRNIGLVNIVDFIGKAEVMHNGE